MTFARIESALEMQVALPRSLLVTMAGGDRYLAANVAVFRALLVSTDKMRQEDYVVLAKVQEDASWLNPAHEDNYYIAAAVLPWNGHYEAVQTILARAMKARPFDYQPAFYFAFNRLHFRKDAVGAAQALIDAAKHVPNIRNQLLLESMAARWLSQNDDLDVSIDVIRTMIETSRFKGMREYLHERLQRLETLRSLRQAAIGYVEKYGQPAKTIADLVRFGGGTQPVFEPAGMQYMINSDGLPILIARPN
ncbi:MAG: hypothetical protein H6943_08990 [Zoogloeaceae bacterium]|nr:hypothetical protein [Zoogloeaceae bacterium]